VKSNLTGRGRADGASTLPCTKARPTAKIQTFTVRPQGWSTARLRWFAVCSSVWSTAKQRGFAVCSAVWSTANPQLFAVCSSVRNTAKLDTLLCVVAYAHGKVPVWVPRLHRTLPPVHFAVFRHTAKTILHLCRACTHGKGLSVFPFLAYFSLIHTFQIQINSNNPIDKLHNMHIVHNIHIIHSP
jgi:hypothetical protein